MTTARCWASYWTIASSWRRDALAAPRPLLTLSSSHQSGEKTLHTVEKLRALAKSGACDRPQALLRLLTRFSPPLPQPTI
jgi:hypothetical protein